jgi:hypothetical protein
VYRPETSEGGPKTSEGAANSSYVRFLFGLIFKYEATTEQGRRSQGPNDPAYPRRRGDRMRRREFITLLGSDQRLAVGVTDRLWSIEELEHASH